MCTYLTEKAEIEGTGKGAHGWFTLTEARVYFDHPVSAPLDHALMIDFVAAAEGPAARARGGVTDGGKRPRVGPHDRIGAGRRGNAARPYGNALTPRIRVQFTRVRGGSSGTSTGCNHGTTTAADAAPLHHLRHPAFRGA